MAQEIEEKSNFKRTLRNIKIGQGGKNFVPLKKVKIPSVPKEPKVQKGKNGGKRKRAKKEPWRIVFLQRIPPGFYEKEMFDYFSQFGRVIQVKLERSKKTGRSKGRAYIEFRYPQVAKIVAETMNNYILSNRLLKAKVLERSFSSSVWGDSNFDTTNYPTLRKREVNIRNINRKKTQRQELVLVHRRVNRMKGFLRRLRAKGVDYSYKPGIHSEIADSSCTAGKYVLLPKDAPVLEIDESDKEIVFMTPPNVLKKKLPISKTKRQRNEKIQKRRKNTEPVVKKSSDKLEEVSD